MSNKYQQFKKEREEVIPSVTLEVKKADILRLRPEYVNFTFHLPDGLGDIDTASATQTDLKIIYELCPSMFE